MPPMKTAAKKAPGKPQAPKKPSTRSKTGNSACSQAASNWQLAIRGKAPLDPDTYKTLGKCRAMARSAKSADDRARMGYNLSEQGRDAIKGRLQKRFDQGLVTQKSRQDRLKTLLTQRKEKQAAVAAKQVEKPVYAKRDNKVEEDIPEVPQWAKDYRSPKPETSKAKPNPVKSEYDPETAVYKGSRGMWWVKTVEGGNFPTPFKTKREGIERAKLHKEMVAYRTTAQPAPAPAPAKFSRGGQLAPGRGTNFRRERAKYLLEERKNSQNAKQALAEATREQELPWMVNGVEITGDPNFRPQVATPVARFTAARNQKAAELRKQRLNRQPAPAPAPAPAAKQYSPVSRPSVDHSFLSPSGRVSKRSKERAIKKTSETLFGPGGMPHPQLPKPPTEQEYLRRQAAELRDMASRGLKPRAYKKKADELEAKANSLDSPPAPAKFSRGGQLAPGRETGRAISTPMSRDFSDKETQRIATEQSARSDFIDLLRAESGTGNAEAGMRRENWLQKYHGSDTKDKFLAARDLASSDYEKALTTSLSTRELHDLIDDGVKAGVINSKLAPALKNQIQRQRGGSVVPQTPKPVFSRQGQLAPGRGTEERSNLARRLRHFKRVTDTYVSVSKNSHVGEWREVAPGIRQRAPFNPTIARKEGLYLGGNLTEYEKTRRKARASTRKANKLATNAAKR